MDGVVYNLERCRLGVYILKIGWGLGSDIGPESVILTFLFWVEIGFRKTFCRIDFYTFLNYVTDVDDRIGEFFPSWQNSSLSRLFFLSNHVHTPFSILGKFSSSFFFCRVYLLYSNCFDSFIPVQSALSTSTSVAGPLRQIMLHFLFSGVRRFYSRFRFTSRARTCSRSIILAFPFAGIVDPEINLRC